MGIQKPSVSEEYWWQSEGDTQEASDSSCLRQVPGGKALGPSIVWFKPAMAPPSCKAPCGKALSPTQWFSLSALSLKSWKGLSEEARECLGRD